MYAQMDGIEFLILNQKIQNNVDFFDSMNKSSN